GDWGIFLNSSDSNALTANTALGNPVGIELWNSDRNTVDANTACSDPGPDFSVHPSQSSNSGDNNRCDAPDGWNDTGGTGCTYRCDSLRYSTCSDNTRNGDEEATDCGGTYCPPCSQCLTAAIYAPSDTPCQHAWPTSDGPDIDINTESESCNLVEVCDPNLDHIVEDALLCCEHQDYAGRLTEPRRDGKMAACTQAHTRAYDPVFGFDRTFNPDSLKTCLAHYIINSFGQNAVYMQGYFDGEWSCYGERTEPNCNEREIDPPAWQMGTAASCAGSGGAQPDFQMEGQRCEYYWMWLLEEMRWGKPGYWHSDDDWRSNSDSVVDLPAHASIERLSTGTSVDYAMALATVLRKAGYSRDEVYAVDGEKHDYNLIRFPGDAKWHYVDTVGNTGGGVQTTPATGYDY
ncbi:MAG: NosD domain-containing protein, partial [Planctomycetota bacterium]